MNSLLNISAQKTIKRSNIHNRDTRMCDALRIPIHKTATGQRTFTYGATEVWNSLDKVTKEN